MRNARLLIAGLAAASLLSSCGSPEERPTASDLSFAFTSVGGPGNIDQTLDVTNSGGAAVVLDLDLVALDDDGRELPDVAVSTAFGTDVGRHVVPADFTDFDVLTFAGDGYREVEDLRVNVREVREVSFAADVAEPVEAVRLDEGGAVVEPPEPYASVRLSNPNDHDVAVRVALIEYETPPPGEAQQAVSVSQLGSLVMVPGGSASVIDGPAGQSESFVSVKAYFSR